jgi:uncharacterized membrane protein
MNQAATRFQLAPELAVASQSQAKSRRLVVLDMLRGVAMLLMALEHSAWFAHTNYVAESYGGARPRLDTLPHIIIGLFTNAASGIFFTLTGVSVAFFENSRRKRGWTEGQITRFFLTRAAILVVLDWTLSHFAWHQPTLTFDVLSAIAFALVILAFVRRLPLRWIALLSAALFLVYPLLVDWFPYNPQQPLSVLTTYLLQYHPGVFPYVEFSALGRLSLVLAGYVAGRLLIAQKWTLSPRLLWLALAAFIAGVVLRLLGGYGNFSPLQPGDPFIDLFIESKQPPSVVFLLYNITKGLVLLVVLQFVLPRFENSFAGRALTVLGQTSLFFYVTHLLLYSCVVSRIIPDTILPGHDIARDMLEWMIGLAILIPLCAGYRHLRQRHPNSILQYL